uniref:Peptidase C1A papain C-terminal domain-containing protein n=1 Tax=Ixodes ricinus TaxID=34613 RepID=A0A0K8RJR4_IXORI
MHLPPGDGIADSSGLRGQAVLGEARAHPTDQRRQLWMDSQQLLVLLRQAPGGRLSIQAWDLPTRATDGRDERAASQEARTTAGGLRRQGQVGRTGARHQRSARLRRVLGLLHDGGGRRPTVHPVQGSGQGGAVAPGLALLPQRGPQSHVPRRSRGQGMALPRQLWRRVRGLLPVRERVQQRQHHVQDREEARSHRRPQSVPRAAKTRSTSPRRHTGCRQMRKTSCKRSMQMALFKHSMLVKEDFFLYSSGVYKHTRLAHNLPPEYQKSDWHSVRILGWGVDRTQYRPQKYWLCANSWGSGWGENGYFRIVRGEDESQIESFVLAVWGRSYASYYRQNYGGYREQEGYSNELLS